MSDKYNFDELTERRGTGCVKWDESPFADVIPLWVADMDFRVAPAIEEAVSRRAQHPVYG
jgi:cystathionine beta-lyase